jgi:hypothetical protein
MDLTIRSVKYAKGDKSDQIPLRVTLLRQLPGPDRPDYWIGQVKEPFEWTGKEDGQMTITHLVLASQWENTRVSEGVTRLPVGIAYVIDPSLLDDDELDIDKIRFVAHAVADDPDAENPVESLVSRMTGTIAGMFGKRG